MKGELYFNDSDVFEQYGIVMGQGSLSALIAPPQMKQLVTTSSRLIDGKRASINNLKVDSRSLSIQIYITAKDREEFLERLAKFTEEVLYGGAIKIETKYQRGVVYKCIYDGISQFSEFNGKIGKFILKVTELNPRDRIGSNLTNDYITIEGRHYKTSDGYYYQLVSD